MAGPSTRGWSTGWWRPPSGPLRPVTPRAGSSWCSKGPTRPPRYWEATTDEAWRPRSRRFAGLSRAPVVVLPFADPDAYVARYREPDKVRGDGQEVEWVVPFWCVDAAFAIMTLLLGATERGLGAAFLGNFRGEAALHAASACPTGSAGWGPSCWARPPSPIRLRPRPATPPDRRGERPPGRLVAGGR